MVPRSPGTAMPIQQVVFAEFVPLAHELIQTSVILSAKQDALQRKFKE